MRMIRATILVFAVLTIAFFSSRWLELGSYPAVTLRIKSVWASYIVLAAASAVWCRYPRRWLVTVAGVLLFCLTAYALGSFQGRIEVVRMLRDASSLWWLVPCCGLTFATMLAILYPSRDPYAVGFGAAIMIFSAAFAAYSPYDFTDMAGKLVSSILTAASGTILVTAMVRYRRATMLGYRAA